MRTLARIGVVGLLALGAFLVAGAAAGEAGATELSGTYISTVVTVIE